MPSTPHARGGQAANLSSIDTGFQGGFTRNAVRFRVASFHYFGRAAFATKGIVNTDSQIAKLFPFGPNDPFLINVLFSRLFGGSMSVCKEESWYEQVAKFTDQLRYETLAGFRRPGIGPAGS
jgi:hypothetical protein